MAGTFQLLVKEHKVCAAALAVVKHREIASIESAAGCPQAMVPAAESVFQAASLSKPVFAYAVLQLVAQGKMSLDTPLMHYLPQGYRHRFDPLKAEPSELVSDPRLRAVTVRMALNHTAGLPNWASGPLRFASVPGSQWAYSGEGYVLLQRALESVTGAPMEQFMRVQIFPALGMGNSSFIMDEKAAKRMMAGTRANGAARHTVAFSEPIAAFSLTTSAADYGTFLSAVLSDRMLLDQITALPVKADARNNLSWGLGWGIEETARDLYIWQWGNNPGYRAFAMASVRTGDGFVLLTNSENGLALAEPLARNILNDQHKLFQSPVLGFDFVNAVCKTLHLCL